MKVGSRVFLWGALLVLAAFPVLGRGQSPTATAEGPIYIGLSAPITGDYAEYGAQFRKSIMMAMDQVNAAGGVLGRPLELVVGDSKGDPKESAALAQKYTSDPKIAAVIGDFTSTCCLAAQPIYDQFGMVQLSPTSSHPEFAKGSKWSFTVSGNQAAEAPYQAKMAINDLGFKKIAILHINNDWGLQVLKYFKETADKLGAEITKEEFYFDGERDFTAMLTKLKASDPEMLMLVSMYNDGSLISKQRQKLGWDIPVMITGSAFSQKLIELGGDAVEGIYCETAFFAKDPTPHIAAFVQEFEKRYDQTPNVFSGLGYDAMMVLADAIKRAGSTESDAIRAALQATKGFPGVVGEITFTENGDVFKSYRPLTIKNGEWVIFEP